MSARGEGRGVGGARGGEGAGLRVGLELVAQQRERLLYLEEAHVLPAAEGGEHAGRLGDVGRLEQRVGERLLQRQRGAPFARRLAHADEGEAPVAHHLVTQGEGSGARGRVRGLRWERGRGGGARVRRRARLRTGVRGRASHRAHVRKVEVDQARGEDEVGDRPHRAEEHAVRHAEGGGEGRVRGGHREQLLVGHHDQRVHLGTQLLQALPARPKARVAAVLPWTAGSGQDLQRSCLGRPARGSGGRTRGSGGAQRGECFPSGRVKPPRAAKGTLSRALPRARPLDHAALASRVSPAWSPRSRTGARRRRR